MSLLRVALVAIACTARADVRLPAVISDHMVLQSNAADAIWGWAAPQESISVSIAGQTKSATADASGKWSVRLDPLAASSQPQTLTIKGKNTLTIHDVLVGEVWLASGQSNMAMQLNGPLHGFVDRGAEEVAAAKYPSIRVFQHDAPFAIYELPVPPAKAADDRPGKWIVCSPETASNLSAIGYFFARDLHQYTKAPVGIITSAVGGTPIEGWTSLDAQQKEATLKPLLEDWEKRLTGFDPAKEQAAFLEAKEKWLKVRAAATKAGQPAPKAPAPFKNIGVMTPGGLFNGMIAPLVPYTIRGVIWYQGERNAAGPFTGLYGTQLQTLIADWRARWGHEFHFAWVQLPGFQKPQTLPVEPKGWGAAVRDEMRKTLSVPRTSMAITIDLGGEKAGHPTNKSDFGTRLSRVVLHDVYGDTKPGWTGPLFRSATREGDKMILTFDHAAGLRARAGDLAGFAIAGKDKKFVWADARIDGDKVIVSNAKVSEPTAVRYSWAANPKGNLVNGAALPASPFRTDDWN